MTSDQTVTGISTKEILSKTRVVEVRIISEIEAIFTCDCANSPICCQSPDLNAMNNMANFQGFCGVFSRSILRCCSKTANRCQKLNSLNALCIRQRYGVF
jgi:hypothetical protein